MGSLTADEQDIRRELVGRYKSNDIYEQLDKSREKAFRSTCLDRYHAAGLSKTCSLHSFYYNLTRFFF